MGGVWLLLGLAETILPILAEAERQMPQDRVKLKQIDAIVERERRV
jgi:hypothetical protein